MAEATDKWANTVLEDVAIVRIALNSLHGENIGIGIDVTGLADAAAATEALRTASQGASEGESALATAAASAAGAAAGAGVATAAAATGTSLFMLGVQGAHLALTVFGAQLVADTVGIAAFGIAAYQAIGPVITSLSTLTTSYGSLDNYQRAAALSLQGFLNELGGGSEAGVFTVFNQALGLVESHLSTTGGITQQATIAFMDFFAMLKQQFASAGWADLFTRTSGVIRTDMDALFGTINNLLGVVPALFHNFNFLGLGALSAVNGVLRLTAAVANFDPTLTRWVAGVAAAASAYHLLSGWVGFLPTMSQLFARTGLNAISLTGAMENLSQFGLLPTLSFMTGITPEILAAAGGFAVLGGAFAAFVYASQQDRQPAQDLIANLTAQDQAVGDNIVGYTRLASQLTYYQSHLTDVTGTIHGTYGAITQVTNAQHQLTAAQQAAASTATTLNHNFAFLSATYGLSRQQAFQLAQATGVNLKQALTGSSQSAVEARTKIAAYEQTVNAARQVETQFAFDMQQATNSTLTWTTRLQGLATAFNVLTGPLLGAMNASAAFKQAQVALNQAEDQGTNIAGTATAKQAALTQALAAADAAAIKDSEALFNQAKETGNAANAASIAVGPLVAMKDQILDLGLKGQAAAALVAQLNQEINALHSKSVTLTTNVVTNYSAHYAHIGAQGGFAGGTSSATPGLHLVGEQGPELVAFAGGERVLPAPQTARMLAGGGGGFTWSGDLHVHGTVIAQQDLRAVVQAAVLDAWTRNRGTGFAPYGFGLR